MRSMLGGFSKVDPKHPVWADVLEIPNITLVKLSALREKFLPKGMEGIMTEEARNERERKPEDGLEIHEGEGIKAGTVLNIRGKLNSSEFKFTFVTSQPQRMWPTQDMTNGRVRVNNLSSQPAFRCQFCMGRPIHVSTRAGPEVAGQGNHTAH
jgi:hypothetical protein